MIDFPTPPYGPVRHSLRHQLLICRATCSSKDSTPTYCSSYHFLFHFANITPIHTLLYYSSFHVLFHYPTQYIPYHNIVVSILFSIRLPKLRAAIASTQIVELGSPLVWRNPHINRGDRVHQARLTFCAETRPNVEHLSSARDAVDAKTLHSPRMYTETMQVLVSTALHVFHVVSCKGSQHSEGGACSLIFIPSLPCSHQLPKALSPKSLSRKCPGASDSNPEPRIQAPK